MDVNVKVSRRDKAICIIDLPVVRRTLGSVASAQTRDDSTFNQQPSILQCSPCAITCAAVIRVRIAFRSSFIFLWRVQITGLALPIFHAGGFCTESSDPASHLAEQRNIPALMTGLL